MNRLTLLLRRLAAASLLLLATAPSARAADAPEAKPFSGRVVETMNSGGYTYILVEHGPEKTWVASRQFAVATGDQVQIPGGWVMKDFQSTTLERKFEWILFAPRVQTPNRPASEAPPEAAVNGSAPTLPAGHPPLSTADSATVAAGVLAHPAITPPPPKISKPIAPSTGGQTLATYRRDARKFAGRIVPVRGLVVKYSGHILGRNWVHVRDGSGENGESDLVLTTRQEVAVGDLITAKGKLTRDRDFGAGYRFDVLLEDAEVKVEKEAGPGKW